MTNEVNNNIPKEEQTMFDFDLNEIKELLADCDTVDRVTEAIFSNPELLHIEIRRIRGEAAARYHARKNWRYNVQILKKNNVEKLDLVFYVNSAGFIVPSHAEAFSNLSKTIEKHTGPIEIKLCCGGKRYREKTVLIPACEHMLEKTVIKQPDLERLCEKYSTKNLFKLYYADNNEFAKEIVHKYNGWQFDKMSSEASADSRLYPLAKLIRWSEQQGLHLYWADMPRAYAMATWDIDPIQEEPVKVNKAVKLYVATNASKYGVDVPTCYRQKVTAGNQTFVVKSVVPMQSISVDYEVDVNGYDLATSEFHNGIPVIPKASEVAELEAAIEAKWTADSVRNAEKYGTKAEKYTIDKSPVCCLAQYNALDVGYASASIDHSKLEETAEIISYLQSCGDDYVGMCQPTQESKNRTRTWVVQPNGNLREVFMKDPKYLKNYLVRKFGK